MLVLRLADCERVLLRCGWWGSIATLIREEESESSVGTGGAAA